MSYAEGRAFRVLMQHRWSAALGGCVGGDCEWVGNHDEIEQIDHCEHVADMLAQAELFIESKKSVAVIKAEALYDVADELCTCNKEEGYEFVPHEYMCPTRRINKRADRMR